VATVVTLRVDQGRPARRRIDAPVRGIAIGTMISSGEFNILSIRQKEAAVSLILQNHTIFRYDPVNYVILGAPVRP
jgi:hypothetical protein